MSYLQAIVKTKGLLLKIFAFLNKPALYAWYVFFFYASYLILTYMTLDRVFSLDDHFFHIKFAELLREKGTGALTDFQSIYFSRMGLGHQYLVYYNFLFYLVLIPFTFLNPLVLGIKLYGVFALSVSFTIVYVFLKKVSVRLSFLWTLLFLAVLLQSNLLLRFTLARPFTLAPVFLVLMLYFIYQKKYWAVAIISFLYFYWHTATFIFPFCLAFGYFLFEQFYGKKPDWKLIGWSFFGTGGAVFLVYLISPGIVTYLKDVIFPVFFDTTLAKTTKIAEGSEVYGKDFFAILSSFFWFLAALFIVGTYEILRYVETKRGLQNQEDKFNLSVQPLRVTLFVASLVFLAASALSGRFLDYFAYFCLLYIAIAVSDVAKFFKIDGKLFRKSFWIGGSIIALYLIVNLSLNFYDSLAGARSQLIAQGSAEWLNVNEPQGKIIFNADWDSFPTMYYFTGDKFRYVTGLEPRFLYDLNHQLYWKWFNIGKGIYCESSECPDLVEKYQTISRNEEGKKQWEQYEGNLIADAVLNDFKTDTIVTSVGRKDLLAVMDNSSRFEKKFFDDKNSAYAIYKIIEEK
jgi:hypothetical protein